MRAPAVVLAFDTATPDTVVGLAVAGAPVAGAVHRPAPSERPAHAAQVLVLAQRLLADAGLAPRDVTRVGVGVGPGTFTGLRIGVATARALVQATGAELAAVGTLHALAHAARDGGHDGGVLACLDARRGEAFAAAQVPGAPAPGAACAVAPADLGTLLDLPGAPWLAVGDGALRYRTDLPGARVPANDDPRHRVDAAILCALAAAAPVTDRDALAPVYIRPPDAVPRAPAPRRA